MQWNDIDKTRQRDDKLKLRIGTWWSHFPRPMQEILRLEIMHLCHNLCRFCGILYWLSNSPWSFKSRVNSCVSKYTKDPQKLQKFTNSDFQTHFGYMFFQFLHMFGPLWILTGTMMQRTFFYCLLSTKSSSSSCVWYPLLLPAKWLSNLDVCSNFFRPLLQVPVVKVATFSREATIGGWCRAVVSSALKSQSFFA